MLNKMSSGRNWLSLGGDSRSKDSPKPLPPDVVKVGHLKKLKVSEKSTALVVMAAFLSSPVVKL